MIRKGLAKSREARVRETSGHRHGFPSFAKEGWTRRKEESREASIEQERTGWLFQATAYSSRAIRVIGAFKQPPRLRRLRMGAICFMAQPPLLREGGETARPSACACQVGPL